MTVQAGTAVVDITPPAGLAMAGFAARQGTATGTHDPLTVRAVAIDDTAVLVADVIGLDEEFCARVRNRATLPADCIVVAALHTHGGPAVMPGSLFSPVDGDYYGRLEDACVTALDQAAAARRPAQLYFGAGHDPDVARNRRHPDGLVDGAVPVLRIHGKDNRGIAVVTAYACHPVVLGADNTLWTADYPGVVRDALEEAHPGAAALFMTGCCGDANHGHSAASSLTTAANPDRTFDRAATLGRRIADAALAAEQDPLSGKTGAANAAVGLDFARREAEDPETLAARWRATARDADPVAAAIHTIWATWAETTMATPLNPFPARVTVLDWGGALLVALPGEIFAETALAIRDQLQAAGIRQPAFVVGYADANPGYIPPASEFAHGGYEVDEAHRFYNRPATFAPGAAERLAVEAVTLAASLTRA
ncbi:MAG: alkaline ceramidase [Hyphomicrobiales bacterium]|nr:alkaline ceramidase [Hyphomicrobiales bacterium]